MKSFRKGNHLLAVHVNSVRGKDQQTKPLGPNPFEFVGVTYSEDGKIGTLWERNGETWTKYDKIDGTAYFGVNAGPEHSGKGFILGHFFRIYGWVRNDGYNNFPGWLK